MRQMQHESYFYFKLEDAKSNDIRNIHLKNKNQNSNAMHHKPFRLKAA